MINSNTQYQETYTENPDGEENQEYIYLPFVVNGSNGPEKGLVVSYNTHDGSDIDWAIPLNAFVMQVSPIDRDVIVGLQEATPDEIRTRMQEYGWNCVVSELEQHLCDIRPSFGFDIVLDSVQIHPMPACREKDRVAISARVVNPEGKEFYIITSHICHVDDVRQTALGRIEEIVRNLGGEAVVAADFNTQPEELIQRGPFVSLACGSTADPRCQSVGSRGHVDNVAIVFTDPNTGEQLSIIDGQRGIVTTASDHTPVGGEIVGARRLGTNRKTIEYTGVPDNNYPGLIIDTP